MTEQELKEILKQSGMEVAISVFEDEIPAVPYITIIKDTEKPCFADGKIVFVVKLYKIELYMTSEDDFAQQIIEKILAENNILWNKENAIVESEKLYVAIYAIEMEG